MENKQEKLLKQEKEFLQENGFFDDVKKELLQKKLNDENTVFIAGTKKTKTIIPFTIFFAQNYYNLLETKGFGINEQKILFKLLDLVYNKNNDMLISFNQKSLAKELNIDISNFYKSFKKLKELKIILDNKGHLFINYNLFCKTNLFKAKETECKKISDQNETKEIKKAF